MTPENARFSCFSRRSSAFFRNRGLRTAPGAHQLPGAVLFGGHPWPNDFADAGPSLSGCGACRLNRSAGTALPRASFARPPCLTTFYRSPRAAAMTTATSAVSVRTATRPARPSSLGSAGRSAPARMAGRLVDPPRGRVESLGPGRGKPRMVQKTRNRELATGGHNLKSPAIPSI